MLLPPRPRCGQPSELGWRLRNMSMRQLDVCCAQGCPFCNCPDLPTELGAAAPDSCSDRMGHGCAIGSGRTESCKRRARLGSGRVSALQAAAFAPVSTAQRDVLCARHWSAEEIQASVDCSEQRSQPSGNREATLACHRSSAWAAASAYQSSDHAICQQLCPASTRFRPQTNPPEAN